MKIIDCRLRGTKLIAGVLFFALFMGFGVKAWAGKTRIVVLPFYVEEGFDASQGGVKTLDFRRVMRFINNQLVRHNFEVVNPFAAEANEKDYNRLMERARQDSPLASIEVNKKYATDAAYIVWLTLEREQTSDGFCEASARLDGEGYDSAGRDLGVGLNKSLKATKLNCDDAIAAVEKKVGDEVGRTLTAWDTKP